MALFEASLIKGKKFDNISNIPKCGACKLKYGCKSPLMPISGNGRRRVLVVAEAPGEIEDERNEQLVGPAGIHFREILDEIGIDLDRDCWKTNALICRPPNNREPSSDEIDYCRPNLTNSIEKLKPDVVIPLGAAAIRSVIGPYWKEDIGTVTQWVGWNIPHIKTNMWICPTYHPSFVLRCKDERNAKVVRLLFKTHLKDAFNHRGMPYDDGNKPDYGKFVQVIHDPRKAAGRIDDIVRQRKVAAFDYETNRLKPDPSNAQIFSCAISNGDETIAYPWVGAAIEATGRFLASDVPKIGANIRFEDRWTRRFFGFPVNRWVWCTVTSAHHLDNRKGITSVKFQAFVRLGFDPWNAHLDDLLKSVDEGGLNRIKDEIDLDSLLLYNGLDALLEWKLAQHQRKEMLNGQSHA